MRKNNLFLLLLMALIVMSCSKDETTMGIPQEGNAIEFGTYVGRDAQTRASVFTTTELASQGFGVFAYYTGKAEYANWPLDPLVTSKKPNFMNNQKVTGTSSGSEYTWTYSPIKYWPNNVDDKVSFFAYAPYSGGSQNNISDFTESTATGDPTLKFTVNGTVKEQTDLVWGVKTDDGVPFLDQTKQTIGGNIKFQFKHALARIGFNVEAMFDTKDGIGTGNPDSGSDDGTENGTPATDAKTDIVVTKVELVGKFYESGVLNLNSTVTGVGSVEDPKVSVPNWGTLLPEALVDRTFALNAGDATASNFNGPTSVGLVTGGETFGKNVTNAKAKLNADDSYLMVIPQNFTSDKIKITVTYDVITKDGNLDTGQSKITNVITSDEFTFNFEHGKAYTFNLHLGMTSVKFDATVSDWGTETGTVVNVPINTN